MAWEWVGPVSTATVGVAGIVGTWLTGKQGREDAKKISDATLANARLLATEARKQQRLESAYLELLETTGWIGVWVQNVLPMTEKHPPETVPEMPSLEAQLHMRAVVDAYGSSEVRGLVTTWRSLLQQAIALANQIRREEKDRDRASARNLRLDLESLRPKEREIRESLAKLVSTELGHRTVG